MDVSEILVVVEHETGHSGVVRGTDGAIWLSHSVERLGGPRLNDYRPDHLELENDRTLLGGRLVPGAVSAEAVDERGVRVPARVGGGAWVVVLDQPVGGCRSAVCMRDADGVPVAAPLPASWARIAVTDTEEPCPACGQVAWDEVRPTDESRGGRSTADGRTEPMPVVVCRGCGHEEPIGGILQLSARADEDSAVVEERVSTAQVALRAKAAEALGGVDFPIYAADGLACRYSGRGASGGNTDRVTVAYGASDWASTPQLRIETSIDAQNFRSEIDLAQAALEHWLWDNDDKPLPQSDAAIALKFSARRRDQRQRAAAASACERTIRVDDSPRPFQYLEREGRWVAVRRTAAMTLVVSGRGIDPDAINLKPVADPVAELLSHDD